MRKDEFINKCILILSNSRAYGLVPFIINGEPDENGTYPPQQTIPPHKMNTLEAGKIYDFLEEYDFFKKEVTEEVYPTPTKISEILMVEDGSCDVETLKKQGYKIIVYRQGSRPPYFMEDKKETK